VVARDARGSVVVAMCKTIPSIMDPTTAEAMAAWHAVDFSCVQGFQRLILEGDALAIVQSLRQQEPSWTRYGQFIEDSHVLLNGLNSGQPLMYAEEQTRLHTDWPS
jgi:hypothetical protein